jgi:hypothetical protein
MLVLEPRQDPSDVGRRLASADVRLGELFDVEGPWTGGDQHRRTRLMQEFFFHLIGAVEILVHLINERLGFMDNCEVTIRAVCIRLEAADRKVLADLGGLCQQVKNNDVPGDPYSKDGLLFRAYLYRHLVSHSHMSRLVLRVGS